MFPTCVCLTFYCIVLLLCVCPIDKIKAKVEGRNLLCIIIQKVGEEKKRKEKKKEEGDIPVSAAGKRLEKKRKEKKKTERKSKRKRIWYL